MNSRFSLFLGLIMLFGISAHAIFENVSGVYKIVNCKNEATNPSPWDLPLCDNPLLVIYSNSTATTVYFSKLNGFKQAIRAFYLPPNMSSCPQGKYFEKGDYYAAFTNDDKGSGEIFVMKKTEGVHFHFSMHRRSDFFKTFDIFEMDVEKVSNQSAAPPTTEN